MKLVESADGTVKVIELDPSKMHWIILDADALLKPEQIRMRDGLIFIKRPGAEFTVIEGDTPPELTVRSNG